MVFVVHSPGDQMYLIRDPGRGGFLTWDHDDKRYIMAFTSSDKAEEYNAVVMENRTGEVVRLSSRDSRDFARKMVKSGVDWMIIDYPVINDQDFWDAPVYQIGAVPREVGRDYSVVDLKGIVARV